MPAHSHGGAAWMKATTCRRLLGGPAEKTLQGSGCLTTAPAFNDGVGVGVVQRR
jgi:hypothetical protein